MKINRQEIQTRIFNFLTAPAYLWIGLVARLVGARMHVEETDKDGDTTEHHF